MTISAQFHLVSWSSHFAVFLDCHLFFLLSLSHFPLSSDSFLRPALLLIFCPIHEVLLPEDVFKLHPAKRHHKSPALASHNSPDASPSDFVFLHDSLILVIR